MIRSLALALFASHAVGTIIVSDPSDTINPVNWAADNAVLADYNITPTLYQTKAIVGPYSYNGRSLNISHQTLAVNKNDTSVLVIANQSDVAIDNTNVIKSGYCSNLFQASFYGQYPLTKLVSATNTPDRPQCSRQYRQ